MPKKSSLPTAPPESLGRDEMNLAEFPIALLSQRVANGELSFTCERTLALPRGGTLQQTWCVTGAPKYGLPQPADEDVMLGLLKIAADNGFESPVVHFSQSGLLALLRWTDQGFYYRRLEQALARLKTTAILATNAFWNNSTKSYETHHFGVIDSYKLYERRGNGTGSQLIALSSNWARFSDEFFSSMQAGYLKPLNLGRYFSLRSSVSKRLYRYLDKKRYQKESFSINLQQLASVHLGLSDKICHYPSWIKRELDRAHDELCESGFLTHVEYGRSKAGAWKVIYAFNNEPPSTQQLVLPMPSDRQAEVVALLVARDVSPSTARELVASREPQSVAAHIDVFDYLCRMSHGKPLQNPAGFLVESIRNAWTLRPPGYQPPAVRERMAQSEREEETMRQQRAADQATQQQKLEAQRASLSEDELQVLREEAWREAQKQLGTSYRLKRDSRMVEAFLNGLIQQRLLEMPSA